MKGLTGVIKFDHQGFRSDFTLDIIELTRDGLQKAGIWNSSEGVNYTRSYGENQKQIVEILQNKTLIVTTILVSKFWYTQCVFIRFWIRDPTNSTETVYDSLVSHKEKINVPHIIWIFYRTANMRFMYSRTKLKCRCLPRETKVTRHISVFMTCY